MDKLNDFDERYLSKEQLNTLQKIIVKCEQCKCPLPTYTFCTIDNEVDLEWIESAVFIEIYQNGLFDMSIHRSPTMNPINSTNNFIDDEILNDLIYYIQNNKFVLQ